MGSFKKFLNESEETLVLINSILNGMHAEEIDDLGYVLYKDFFAEDEEDLDDLDLFTIDDVNEMIEDLGSEMYDAILDMLSVIDDDHEVPVSHEQSPGNVEESEDLDEAVSRRMKVGQMNRKKRKFMKNTKADMRKTKAQRKKKARQDRTKRKRHYRANKQKIASYQKSRSVAIKKGKHKTKLRRTA